MAKPYQHLTLSNRILIEHERCKGSSCQDLAQMLKVHRTTIARELRRNSLPNGRYDHQLAQLRAQQRRRTVANSQPRPKTARLWDEFAKRYDNVLGKCLQSSIMGARVKLRIERELESFLALRTVTSRTPTRGRPL